MDITLDQARALDAVARHGTFAKAATELHKVHTAVLYALRQLEGAVGLPLFDRSGYRATLTEVGLRVLEHCRRLLAAQDELARFCEIARLGYEPTLTVVFDGLLPVSPILEAVRAVTAASPETRVAVYSEFLGDVETRAQQSKASIVIAVVPLETPMGEVHPLPSLTSILVVAKDHPLAAQRPDPRRLALHPFLTVRASDQRLQMSTSALEKPQEFRLSDFHAKKVALLAGMGWGWMPEHLITDELARGDLVALRWGDRARHVFRPMLHRTAPPNGTDGIASKVFLASLTAALSPTRTTRATPQPLRRGRTP